MKMNIKPISCLRNAPLLKGLDDHIFEQVAEGARAREYKRRLGLIDNDELGQRLHFVLSGEMHMLRVAPDGQECLIQRFSAGEFFCLASLFSGRRCSNHVVSATTSQVLFWSQEWFRQLLQADASFYRNLLEQMARQVEQERSLRTLSRCSRMESRLAAYLLHKLDSAHCCMKNKTLVVDLRPIGLTAQELGIARETLSRSLQRLVHVEGISYQRGQVHISDPRLLEQLLEEADCSCCDRDEGNLVK